MFTSHSMFVYSLVYHKLTYLEANHVSYAGRRHNFLALIW